MWFFSKIQLELLANSVLISATGELNQTSAFISRPVADVSISEVSTTFIGFAAGVLFCRTKAVRFLSDLSEEVSDA